MKILNSLLAVIALLFAGVCLSMAVAAEPSIGSVDATPLFNVLAVIFGNETAAQWVAMLGLVAWVLTQLLAWIPTQYVAKLPSWVISILTLLAGNYGASRNEYINDPKAAREAKQWTKNNSIS